MSILMVIPQYYGRKERYYQMPLGMHILTLHYDRQTWR